MPNLFCSYFGSWRPGPAEIVFPKCFGALRIGLVEIAQQFSAPVKINPIGLDRERTFADLAFVRRGPATSEIFPVIAMTRTNAGHVTGFEIVLVQFRLDFLHQLRRFCNCRQNFTEAESPVGPCRRGGERDQPCHCQSYLLERTPASKLHDLNNLVYCVSCRMLARSARKVALPRSLSDASSARFAVARTVGSSKAKTRWLSVCPKGISRAPADIQFDVSA